MSIPELVRIRQSGRTAKGCYKASVFSMCFPEEVLDYDLYMDFGDVTDGVTLSDSYKDEMDMIDIGCILDAALFRWANLSQHKSLLITSVVSQEEK